MQAEKERRKELRKERRTSARKKLLYDLKVKHERVTQLGQLSHIRNGTFDNQLMFLQRQLCWEIEHVARNRYDPSTRSSYRSGDFTATCEKFLYSDWLKEDDFRRLFAMERENFWKLNDIIKTHDVFKKGKRGPAQAKTEYQLLVLLCYLRTEGNGMTNESARVIFYAGSGSIQKMKDRVLTAIYDVLFTESIFWPDKAEQQVISQSFYEDFMIPNVTTILDGTLFGLAFKPEREDFSDFHGRKGQYTLTCLIANDHRRRIRYYHLGWPGSTHDDRVLSNSWLALNAAEAFGSKGIALGNCAYAPRSWVVPAFKKPAGGAMPANKASFNTLLSKPRVTSEHTIGMLKGRFPILRSLRIRLTEKKSSMMKIQQTVAVCMILHNLLIGWDDEDWELDNDDDSSVTTQLDEANELNCPIMDGSTSDERRRQLFSYFQETIAP